MSRPSRETDFKITPWPVLRNSIAHVTDNARPHTIHGTIQIDVTDAYQRLLEVRRATRVAVSMHSFVLGCVARAAATQPMMSSFRWGNRLVTFDTVDMGTVIDQYATDAMRTRLPVVYIVREADRKSMAQINWEIRAASRRDLGQDPLMKFRRRLSRLPQPVQRVMFRRIMRDPWQHRRVFGTFGFTSVQAPGINYPAHAFVTNLFTGTVAMGNHHQAFLPDEQGQPVLRRVLDLSGSFDHDYVDGMPIVAFGRELVGLIQSAHGLDDEFVRETRELVRAEKAG